MKKEFIIILLLLLISIPAVKSLFIPGGFTSHDLTHHIVRQISMDKLLSEGQFPPRWSGDLAYGYGYPVFLFNYPLPAIIGEVFHKVGLPAGRQGFNFVDSVKGVFFLSLVVSTLGMYLFLYSLLASRMAAFLGAVFYLYSPIHMIVVYVSGSTGASMGLVFPPFIFWSIVELWRKNTSKFLILGSVSFAGLILSHNISAFIFTPIILAFVLILKLIASGKEAPHFLRNIILVFVIGLGLSAFFWIPAMGEKQFIRYDQLVQRVYVDQFPTLRQIIYSPWGYGLSHPNTPEGGMSYQIGLIHILVTMVLFFCIWFFRKKKQFLFLSLFSLLMFLVAIFFMTEASLPLWDILPFLPYVQFPVRLLVVPVFGASLAAALLIKYLPFNKILFVVLLFLVLFANRHHLGINQKYDPGENYYLSLKTSTTSFDEDLPIWVNSMKTDSDHSKFTLISGVGDIKVQENKSARVLAQFSSTSSAKLRFNQYYFPGWQIKVDGNKVKLNYSDIENNGLPTFDINTGSHQILAEFKNTSIRNLADGISIVTVIMLIIFICRPLIRK